MVVGRTLPTMITASTRPQLFGSVTSMTIATPSRTVMPMVVALIAIYVHRCAPHVRPGMHTLLDFVNMSFSVVVLTLLICRFLSAADGSN